MKDSFFIFLACLVFIGTMLAIHWTEQTLACGKSCPYGSCEYRFPNYHCR